jgi:hypothetical protein
MKKFKLTQIRNPHPDGLHTKTKLYSIYLAPGVNKTFTSHRAAQNYAVQYSNDINLTLHTFNILLAELYCSYRASWFYFYDRESGKNYTAVEAFVNSKIQQAEKCLHDSVFRCSGTYGAGRIYQVVTDTANALYNGFLALAEFLYKRRLYVESEKLKIHAAHCRNALFELCQVYGLEFHCLQSGIMLTYQ